jgi:hypothetical protein
MRIKSTILLVCLCASVAYSQGTMNTQWHVEAEGGVTQISFDLPYVYLNWRSFPGGLPIIWSLSNITNSLHIVDAYGNSWSYDSPDDSMNGTTSWDGYWNFYFTLANWDTGRVLDVSLHGDPVSSSGGVGFGHVHLTQWGQSVLYDEWPSVVVTPYTVPEPSAAALAMLGVGAWCLRRKLGGSAGNRASVVGR